MKTLATFCLHRAASSNRSALALALLQSSARGFTEGNKRMNRRRFPVSGVKV